MNERTTRSKCRKKLAEILKKSKDKLAACLDILNLLEKQGVDIATHPFFAETDKRYQELLFITNPDNISAYQARYSEIVGRRSIATRPSARMGWHARTLHGNRSDIPHKVHTGEPYTPPSIDQRY